MAEVGMEEKPRVLILGGTGFIGRNLAEYLVSNELAAKVRVVDKVPPATAWLGGRQKEIFQRIEFKSANLINPASVQRAFDDEVTFDLVVNCASEGRLGQMEPVYNEGIVKLSVNCAKEAAQRGARRYIELSTAHIYAPDKVASTEGCKISPWTDIAQHKLRAEQEISNIKGLNYVVLRPAIVYGPGDRTGLTPRILVGAVYKELKETMRLLWSPELRTNTVHVTDVCRAIWHLRNTGNSGQVFNLADKGNTTQGQTTEFVSQIFGVQYEFLGSVISSVAKISLPEICEELNEKHMEPWSTICQRSGIVNTPLSPFLFEEQLYNKHLCVDGSAIEATGFTYQHPHLTVDSLREVVEGFAAQDLFPRSLLS
ncbi:dTDP-glucose 4,6-dehydratase-like [Branchiostoma floridae]|uniref:dTDP-glucose 4,6-dehydratase-like n=1 Tax=Branchiostoma floridae TaxID=7739 RepID=A0A9J7KV75_BRAFL|nr:dTDP-glucose 4,6-dehydratase-like [Branchiostoma floridae]